MFFEKRGFDYMFWMYEFAEENDYNCIILVKSVLFIIN